MEGDDEIQNDQVMAEERAMSVDEILSNFFSKSELPISTCRQFVRTSQQFSTGSSKKDMVLKYLQNTRECEEILPLLVTSQDKVTEVIAIFQVIEQILLRIVDDLKNFEGIGVSLVQHVMQKHLMLVIKILQCKKSTIQKSAIRMLTSMVMVNAVTAREVLTRLNFDHSSVSQLLTVTNLKDNQDVRTTYICFLISFLMSDNSIIRQFLQLKGVLNSVFLGLKHDKPMTIQIFLSAILSKVVQNPVISKTSKIGLLNDFTLRQVLMLYNWRGPTRWKDQQQQNLRKRSKGDVLVQEADVEQRAVVYEQAHEFLLAVCCSYKNGILFQDPTFGTSGKNMNHILTNILFAIKNPYESSYMEELVTKILSTAPDQIKFYLPKINHMFHPRPSLHWVAAMDFLVKIFENQDVIKHFQKIERQPVKKMVAIILTVTVPTVMTSVKLIEAFQHELLIMRHTALDFIHRILKHIYQFLNSLQNQNSHCFCLKPDEVNEFITCYSKRIIKMLPDPNKFVECWNKAIKEMKAEKNEATVLGLGEISIYCHMQTIMELQILLQKIFPFEKEIYTLDLFSLLTDIQDDKFDETRNISEFQLRLVETIISNISQKDLLNHEKIGPVFVHFLLKIMGGCTSPEIFTTSGRLLLQFLDTSKLVQGKEILLWLHQLQGYELQERNILIQYFESALIKMYSNHLENITSLTKAKLSEEAMDIESKSIKKDGDLEKCSDEMNVGYPNISPLIPAAISVMSEELYKTNTDLCERFLTNTVIDVLHIQENPFCMCALLEENFQIFSSKYFKNYIRSYLGKNDTQLNTKQLTTEENVDVMLQRVFIARKHKKDGIHKEKLKLIENNFAEANPLELQKLTNQCLLYLRIILDEKDLKSEKLVSLICKLLLGIVKHRPPILVSNFSVAIFNPVHLILEEVAILKYFMAAGDSELNLHNKLTENITLFVCNLIVMLTDRIEKKLMQTELHLYIDKFLKCLKNYLKTGVDDALNMRILSSNEKSNVFLDMLQLNDALKLLEVAVPKILFQNQEYVKSLIGIVVQNGADGSGFPLQLSSKLLQKFNVLCQNGEFLIDIANLLQCYPLYSALFEEGLISKCLQDPSMVDKQLFEMASKMIQYNVSHWTHFECCFLQEGTLTSSKKNLILPLIKSYFQSPFAQEQVFKGRHLMAQRCHEIYWKDLKKRFKLASSQTDINIDADISLFLAGIFLHYDLTSAKKVAKLLSKVTFSVWNQDFLSKNNVFVQLMNLVQQYLCKDSSSLINLLSSCLNLFLQNYIAGDYTVQMLQNLCTLIENQDFKAVTLHIFGKSDDKIEWQEFAKAILKTALCKHDCPFLLGLLLKTCEKIIGENVTSSVQDFSLDTIHALIFGHSNFLPIMLGEIPEFKNHREHLIEIILLITKTDPSICDPSHIPLFLASYKATLHEADQKLLKLIQVYESNGVSIQKFRPFVWGEAAVTFYSIERNLAFSLDNEPRLEQVLQLFDPEQLLLTALNFPLNLKLELKLQADVLRVSEVPLSDLYDPRFILTVLSHMLGPGNFVHCKKLVDSKILSIAFAALSCNDNNIRSVGYNVFTLLYPHLESTKYSNKLILLHIIKVLAQGISRASEKLPSMISIFLVKSLCLVGDQTDSMYMPVMDFLFLKPYLDVQQVPEFLQFFNSSDFKRFRIHRMWMLKLLTEGMKEPIDFQVCRRFEVFQMLMSYSNSSLCEEAELVQILNIIKSSVKLPRVASLILSEHALMAVFRGLLSKWSTQRVVVDVLDILRTLIQNICKKTEQFKGKGSKGMASKNNATQIEQNGSMRFLTEVAIIFEDIIRILKNNHNLQTIENWKKLTDLMVLISSWAENSSENYNHYIRLFFRSFSLAQIEQFVSLHLSIKQSNVLTNSQLQFKLRKSFTERMDEGHAIQSEDESDGLSPALQCHANVAHILMDWGLQWITVSASTKGRDFEFCPQLIEAEEICCNDSLAADFKDDTHCSTVILKAIEIALDYIQLKRENAIIVLSKLLDLIEKIMAFPGISHGFVKLLFANVSVANKILFTYLEVYSFCLAPLQPTISGKSDQLKKRTDSEPTKLKVLRQFNEVVLQILNNVKSFSKSVLKSQDKENKTSVVRNVLHFIRTEPYAESLDIATKNTDDVSDSKVHMSGLFITELLLGNSEPKFFHKMCLSMEVGQKMKKFKRKRNRDSEDSASPSKKRIRCNP